MTDQLTALRASWLFDGTALSADPTVLVEGDRIVAAGPDVPVPDGATLVDLPGATILPGLVDCHVHLAFDSSMDPVARLAERDDAALFAAMAEAARQAVRGGVTTVRDLGDRGYASLGLRDAAATDPSLPHIVAAGPPLTTPGGHCHFLGEGAAGVEALRLAIKERADRGVDVIKIMSSGGNMTPGSRPEVPQYGLDELRAAVDEAHRLGLPITAHAHSTQAIADALAAGVDGLEHVSFMTADGVDEIPAGVLDAMARQPVTLSLTFGFAHRPGVELPPAMASRLPAMLANARRMHAAGANIVVGTDAGISPIKPPDVLRASVPQLREIGLSPTEALHAITARAAATCGLADRKGRLARGYDADVLVVDGNPLDDPGALDRIRAVYVRGVRVV